MTTKIFATGVTGYLGGDAVYAILDAHPEYDVTCLVRNKTKGAWVAEAHSGITIVYGELDDGSLLEEEAAKTDIVCNFANATHETSVQALARGLARRTRPGPGFLIHTMGSGTVIYDDVILGRYGQATDKVFNDLEGLTEVLSVPDFARARGAENAARTVGTWFPTRLKTAVVSTGSAYGLGRGILKYRPTAIHELARCTLQRGRGVVVGEGKAAWRHVHVHDLSDLYLKLVEHAAAGGEETEGEPAVWGARGGYFFAENGEHVWGKLERLITAEAVAQGHLTAGEPEVIEPTAATELTPLGQFFWGCNSRVEGRRARQALSWKPHRPPLRDEIRLIVAAEAKKLGLRV
ncbi:hypothetical protein C8A05DRAFT_14855 [Staphylotrichum tortipilum]|uniref:NmrA-like domain-containing protein n=1 Tax=Staphylotrichum tortipilum TaxID=2831512 RepID=A0AAN6RUN1_9PEZI|nr:hypothetical protein C8A05DRAFT_14855 [Staphylotrichum longicolle]